MPGCDVREFVGLCAFVRRDRQVANLKGESSDYAKGVELPLSSSCPRGGC
jgi:hypothetical protein